MVHFFKTALRISIQPPCKKRDEYACENFSLCESNQIKSQVSIVKMCSPSKSPGTRRWPSQRSSRFGSALRMVGRKVIPLAPEGFERGRGIRLDVGPHLIVDRVQAANAQFPALILHALRDYMGQTNKFISCWVIRRCRPGGSCCTSVILPTCVSRSIRKFSSESGRKSEI